MSENEVIRSLVNLLDSEVGNDVKPLLAKVLGLKTSIMELTAKEYLLMKNSGKLDAVRSFKNRTGIDLLGAKQFCESEFLKLKSEFE